MNSIIITGTVGKTITLKYINYLLTQVYKLKTLHFEFSGNKITKIVINQCEEIDLGLYRPGLEVLGKFGLEGEAFLLEEIFKEHMVDIIICKNTPLSVYLTPLICGLTTLDYEISMIVEEIIDDNFKYFILQKEVPLVTSFQSSFFLSQIFKVCETNKNPIFKANFHHLKYINYDTGIKSRYGYVNFALALMVCEVYSKCQKLKNELTLPKFKVCDSDFGKVHLCPLPLPLPKIKNLHFEEYSQLYEHTKYPNLKFYMDPGGTFKSSNLVANQFNRRIEIARNTKTVVPVLLFSCEPKCNLFLTLLPLSTIEFQNLFIINYSDKGCSFEKLQYMFNSLDYLSNDNNSDFDWTETMFETINYIYSEESLTERRIKSMSPLNEYYGFEENIDKCILETLPKTPAITVDENNFVNNWLQKLASKNENIEYYVLVTGCKKIVSDFLRNNDFKI